MKQKQHMTLSELAQAIESGIQSSLPDSYWVVAEISELSVNFKGHCYLELIEKPETSDAVTAKIRATIWSYRYQLIHSYFAASTGLQLQAGLKVLVCATVEFHAVYGLSLSITDIDPVYTIGEDEKQRNDIMQRLHAEGVFTMNKDLTMPLFPQRLAVISSANAAGYQDFCNQIATNQYNLRFTITLFQASMQGVETEQSVVHALHEIFEREHEFDVVIIIRGGGAKADLRWFDNYTIAYHIAQFPLPVITGIGHDKDQSITDMVAHTSVKTPTAAAEFCISLGEQLVFRIQDLQEQLVDVSNIVCDDYRNHLQNKVMRLNHVYSLQTNRAQTDLQYVSTRILSAVSHLVYKQQNKLQFAELKISKSTQHYLIEQKQKLTHALFQLSIGSKHQLHSHKQQLQVLQSQVNIHNPLLLLSKGYTITTNSSGKIIQSIHDVSLHETVLTHVSDGIIESKRVK